MVPLVLSMCHSDADPCSGMMTYETTGWRAAFSSLRNDEEGKEIGFVCSSVVFFHLFGRKRSLLEFAEPSVAPSNQHTKASKRGQLFFRQPSARPHPSNDPTLHGYI